MKKSFLVTILGLVLCATERAFVPIKINNPQNTGGHSQIQDSWRSSYNSNSETFREPNSQFTGLTEMFPDRFLDFESFIISLFKQSSSVWYNDYEWFIYFADRVEQVKWGQTWNLGVFDKFAFCSENDKADICMLFSDGTPTAANIKRASKVKLLCGETKLIEQIEEPNVGQYEMLLYLPSFCEIKEKFDSGSINTDVQSPEHGESKPETPDNKGDGSSFSELAKRLDRLELRWARQEEFDRMLKGCFLFLTSHLASKKFPEDGICGKFMTYVVEHEKDVPLAENSEKSEQSVSKVVPTVEGGDQGEVEDIYDDVTSSEDGKAGGDEEVQGSVADDTYEDINSVEDAPDLVDSLSKVAEVPMNSVPEGDPRVKDAEESNIHDNVEIVDEIDTTDDKKKRELSKSMIEESNELIGENEQSFEETNIEESNEFSEENKQSFTHSEEGEEQTNESKKITTRGKEASKLSKKEINEFSGENEQSFEETNNIGGEDEQSFTHSEENEEPTNESKNILNSGMRPSKLLKKVRLSETETSDLSSQTRTHQKFKHDF